MREEDWQRAGVLIDVSATTYRALVEVQRRAAAQGNAMRGQAEADREVIKSDALRDRAVQRAAGVIMAKIGRDGPQTRGPLRKALPSRDREYFDDAVALLVTAHRLADVLDGRYSAA